MSILSLMAVSVVAGVVLGIGLRLFDIWRESRKKK